MADVHLHVGPPKTGSTYLQNLLWEHRADLARQGVVLPLAHPNEMWPAVNDVQDCAFVHVDMPEARGAWARVAERVAASPGRSLISHEVLGLSTEAHVERIVDSLRPAELHVVVMARGLAAMLPSLWQETVKMVDPDASWPEFLERQRSQRSPWTDTAAIVQRWLRHVPPSRIHVVTVPSSGAGGADLLARFADAAAVDVGRWNREGPANESLDAVQVELLRRVIRSAEGTLDRRKLRRLINAGLLPHLSATRSGGAVRLPVEHRPWIEAESERRRHRLQRLTDAGVVLHGTLRDLDVPDGVWAAAPAAITDGDLLAAALALLTRWETAPLGDGFTIL